MSMHPRYLPPHPTVRATDNEHGMMFPPSRYSLAFLDFAARAPGPVLDIGAAYGYYTLVMADLVGPEGRVLALEPNPWLHWLLQRNLAVNGSAPPALAHRLALGDAEREAQQVRARLTGPFHGPFANWFDILDGTPTTAAPVAPLDGLEPGRVDFLRIGVAGAAEAVWVGMQQVLERRKAVARIELKHEQFTVAQMMDLLRKELLASEEPVRLVAFFESCPSRHAMIVAFLAMLEMVRLQAVVIIQSALFGEIVIRKHKMFSTVFADGQVTSAIDEQYL